MFPLWYAYKNQEYVKWGYFSLIFMEYVFDWLGKKKNPDSKIYKEKKQPLI